MIRMCLISCILPFFGICPWPADCYLRRWRRLRRSVKEAGGSRFFSIAEEEVEKATLFSPRTDIDPHLPSYWHWHSHLSIDIGTCSFSCPGCESPQIELYWHQCWNRYTGEGKREGWCKVVQWAQLKRVIRAVRREPVQQFGLRRPSLSMSLKSTWYYLIPLGIAWPRFCTAWKR